ncbi:NAD(P)-dependent oxidoreductase [Ilyomonas limi]|uniref:NAD(P)-dependent oxidoreductase n=1 Tax=Ilyomonas limi TaxID=2575867 RepID=A0A4U3KTG1_9BACT|nr:Gfo/Idh/MocA family oxidoreductase [Ilyomonas limi]TKK65009.1 NAD(P)-dependent oxidoreductase [Ilyomonas limi]
MIIVDQLLKNRAKADKPIRVAMVGAGFMGKAIALQICKYTQGVQLVAISNRNVEKAAKAYADAGITLVNEVTTVQQLEGNIAQGNYSITNNPLLLCEAKSIEAIIDVTGAVAFGANVVFQAIQNGKHVLSANADLDGTVGPILKVYADKRGVVYTNIDGDQPGVIMNLYRFVKSMGVKPVLCGNIKGLHDPYRNPTTQIAFAKKWGQKPEKVASFADGTKISFEQAIVANGTGMRVAKRGMHGPTVPAGTTIKEVVNLFPLEDMLTGAGIVDYVVGISEPAPGVFVLGTIDDSVQQHYLNLYKLGEGPLYLFYTPYHLCHFEVPNTIARAVLLNDAALTPLGKPYVEVITAAKRDLNAGETIDGIGYYMTYGLCENAEVQQAERLLPIGLAEGCVLKNNIPKDGVITYDNVILPGNRFVERLRKEQDDYFFAANSNDIQEPVIADTLSM